ncbi:PAS domain-containing protein [Pelagibius litoralis]|uniref:PAS domain-containing protein n=1 Tax=Pelagibius litoralis TaxID=374515 RepID=A0A967KAC4_9PROT|nr:PAS domain-containing protein [Pelagibius litoralis]NIA71563.1 PAS domain-containing protein [Pelagibius litoralis]
MQEVLSDIQAAELDLAEGLALYPDLIQALNYWQSKRRGRFAPAREDLDPTEMPALLARIMLADVERAEDGAIDFLYRLSGTGICDVHGYDLATLRPRELSPPDYGMLLHSHYCTAVERREPLAHVLALRSDGKQHSYARIILPLSADGETVTMLLIVDSEKQNSLHEFLEVIRVYGKRA